MLKFDDQRVLEEKQKKLKEFPIAQQAQMIWQWIRDDTINYKVFRELYVHRMGVDEQT